jgi:23S rRNA A2030 N6-methylase RlmJ
MGYGLDDVEDRLLAMHLEQQFDAYLAKRKRVKEEIRKVGYAQYNKFWPRVRRAARIILNKPFVSEQDWRKIVDEQVKSI